MSYAAFIGAHWVDDELKLPKDNNIAAAGIGAVLATDLHIDPIIRMYSTFDHSNVFCCSKIRLILSFSDGYNFFNFCDKVRNKTYLKGDYSSEE